MALTIAGSDSGAGAGLQADLKTFSALGVFGTVAVTAVTAQSTAAVLGVVAMEPAFVDLQLDAVLGDLPVAAVKTGMLSTPAIVRAVGRRAGAGDLPRLVVDPVLVASTGRPLLDEDGVGAYLAHLLPYADVVTPNLEEAALLTGMPVGDLDAMVVAAERLAGTGARTVVVKGGHLGGDTAPDVLWHDGQVTVLPGARVPTTNDHGTGCTLSAAITAYRAQGLDQVAAITHAKQYVARAIRGAARWRLGAGHGPLDHFGWNGAPGPLPRAAPPPP